MQTFVARNRINISRLSFLIVFALILLTAPVWEQPGALDFFMKYLGYVFVVIAVFGRLWSSLFICGYKSKKVVQDGPYSMTRNPLYVFSFVGAVGLGLGTGSLLIITLIIIFFVVVYARTILHEEEKLEELLGIKYLQYKANTPRFFPDLTLYRNVPQYTVNVPVFENAFKDAIWFFLVFGALQIINNLHQYEILPVLFRVP